jgi:hypothetical protein
MTYISIPVAAPKAPCGFEMQKVPIIDPHKLMHALMTTVGVEIPEERVQSYWATHRDELQEDWACQSPATRSHISMAVYGDSAKIRDDGTKVTGIFVSMPAVWRPMSGRCARWCVFAMEEHKLHAHYTLDYVFRRLTYSCNLLFDGLDPEHPGQVLCGGRKFTVTEIKGDWQWLKFTMRFYSSWTKPDLVCFLCNAKGRCHDASQLYYCLDDHPNWTNYNVTTFLADQMTTLDDPCFLTSFGTVCFVLKNVLITGS